MPVLQGNTSGSIIGVAYNIPSKIVTFSLSNKTGGNITASVYVIEQGTNNKVAIAYNISINAGESYLRDVETLVLSGYTIYLVVSGSCDYYFSIQDE